MSILIEIPAESPLEHPASIKQSIKAVFRARFPDHRSMADEGATLRVHIRASQRSYRLTTVWEFSFLGPNFRVQVNFYNRAENDFLRAFTERMVLEASILIRKVNPSLPEGLAFRLDTQTGAIYLYFTIAWPSFYQFFDSKEKLNQLIASYFELMWNYDELMMFLEPAVNPAIKNYQDSDPKKKINRFRMILRNTLNTRKKFQSCIGDLLRYKASNAEFYHENIIKIRQLYAASIIAFQESQIGTQKANENFAIDPSEFQRELKEVQKNEECKQKKQGNKVKLRAKGKTGKAPKQEIDPKIVLGIKDIERQDSLPPEKQLLSQQGAHSQIFFGRFRYKILSSISLGTTEFIETMQPGSVRVIEEKSTLAYKVCNLEAETSINSFRNQLQVLKFLRLRYHPSFAEYYLQQKRSWDEKDIIYMKTYKTNLYKLLRTYKAISFRKRLEITYLIAKGLCFMHKMRICHRDFKPHNIVVDQRMAPKIIDLGSCVSHYGTNDMKVYDERLLTTPGFHIQYHQIPPSHWHVKEKFTKKEYDQHPLFDIYGFGRVINFIFFGTLEPPQPEALLIDPHFEFLDHLLFLINMCLQVDPDDRPGFGEVTAFLGALKQLLAIQFPHSGGEETLQ